MRLNHQIYIRFVILKNTKKCTFRFQKMHFSFFRKYKEGKEIAARMAKARKAKNSLANRLKRLFS
jgi:hypothetical protein